LTWDRDIIGFDGLDFANILLTAAPADPKSKLPPPKLVFIEVNRRPPKKSKSSTAPGVLDLDPKARTTSSFPLFLRERPNKSTLLYKNNPDTNKLHFRFAPPKAARISVATYARKKVRKLGGEPTSHHSFVDDNNFLSRGTAYQDGPDKGNERPPPRAFFLCGGVEVFEIKVPEKLNAQNDTQIDSPTPTEKILVRSPADIFYYTGEGHSNLFPASPGVLTNVSKNLSPEELLLSWQRDPKLGAFTVKAFILAGCSVLGINTLAPSKTEMAAKDRKGVGMRWKRLLISKEGRVENLCGYWGSAPADPRGGNIVADKMVQKIIANPKGNHSENWIQVHLDLKIETTGGALTGNRFFFIEDDGIVFTDLKKKEMDIDP